MSSVFDVAQQLALAISLAVAPAGPDALTGALPGMSSFAQADATRRAPLPKTRIDFRFSEQSWLRAVKEAPPRRGIGALARRIFKTGSGRHYAPMKAERMRILALRWQPELAFRIANDQARKNIARITRLIGRGPTAGELYIAHLIGASNAARLIGLAERQPGIAAAAHMKAAAIDHRELFYAGAQAISAGEIYSRLTRAIGVPKNQPAAARLAGLDWTAQVRANQ